MPDVRNTYESDPGRPALTHLVLRIARNKAGADF